MDENRRIREDSEASRLEDEGIPDRTEWAEDKLGTEESEQGRVPPRNLEHLADFGATAREQVRGVPLRDRLREERPDVAHDDEERPCRIVRSDELDDWMDDRDAVEDETYDSSGLSAEEAAMHEVPDTG